MKEKDREKTIQNILEDLEYTCKSIVITCIKHGIEYDSLTEKELGQIDENIFCCDFCDWWYPAEQKNNCDGGLLCNDCHEEVEEENDDEIKEDEED